MRFVAAAGFVWLSVALTGGGEIAALALAQVRSVPTPPGIVESRSKRELPDEPLPAPRGKQTSAAELRAQAFELTQLANALSRQIDAVNHGALPRYLRVNLKKIEKLAKRLRSELGP